jgi:hypothetical protein
VEALEGRLVLSSDMVLRWNDALLAALRTAGQSPTPSTRYMAIVQAAVYDAVNSIDQSYTPYLAAIPAPPGADESAAAAQAAHDALVGLFPTQATTLDLELKASLQGIPDSDAKTAGIQVGQAAAQNILAARAHDGSANVVDYTPGPNPGDWQPTPPAYGPPLQPQWPQVTPFCLQSASLFRPPPPPALTSPEYTAAFDLTKDLGSSNSTTRTADETEAAMFWQGIATPTSTPPGLWNKIAQEVAISQGNTLVQNARMFALLDLTLADTAIACWDAKYTYNFWRPVTAIRAADTDGNPDTVADPNWTPLLATPSHPSYPSAHATELGGSAEVLASFFGTDAIPFSISWEGLPGVTRSYAGFSAAADEATMSRIWAGFHWGFDLTAGHALGLSVADYVFQNYLLPVTSGRVADRFTLSVPASTTAGHSVTLTLIARYPDGNIATGYTGTVSFASSDPQATLPANYAFTAADNGTHTFAGVTLVTAGAQTLNAQDTTSGALTGSATVSVVAAPADHFLLAAPPTAVSGTPFDVTVTALDPYGNVDLNYTGTITWASSDTDPGVILPVDYTFQATDSGTHTFSAEVTLITPGDQNLSATDTASGITGSATVTVTPSPHPPPGGGARSPEIPSINADGTPAQGAQTLPELASVDWLFASQPQENAGLLWARRKHGGAADDFFGVKGGIFV